MMRISKHGGFIGRYVVSRPLVTYSEAVRRLEKHNLVRGRLGSKRGTDSCVCHSFDNSLMRKAVLLQLQDPGILIGE